MALLYFLPHSSAVNPLRCSIISPHGPQRDGLVHWRNMLDEPHRRYSTVQQVRAHRHACCVQACVWMCMDMGTDVCVDVCVGYRRDGHQRKTEVVPDPGRSANVVSETMTTTNTTTAMATTGNRGLAQACACSISKLSSSRVGSSSSPSLRTTRLAASSAVIASHYSDNVTDSVGDR